MIMSEERNREKSQQRILKAAEKVFSRKGYDGARIDEIAREARCNKALLYYYFKSKRAILDRLMDDFFKESTKHLAEFVASGGLSDDESIQESKAYQPMFEYMSQKRDLLRVLIMESLKDDDVTPHIFRFVDVPPDQAAQLLDALTSAGLAPDSDMEYSMLLEFFTGVIPTIMFIVLEDAWSDRFGIEKKKTKAMFMKAYEETHMAHHRNIDKTS